jgi:hypothetical protein
MKIFLLFSVTLVVVSSLVGCSKQRGLRHQVRDSSVPLVIELCVFDDQEEQSRMEHYVGSARVNRNESNDSLKNAAIGRGNHRKLEGAKIHPVKFGDTTEKDSSFALAYQVPDGFALGNRKSSVPILMPLLYRHSGWGFVAPEDYEKDHAEFKLFLSKLENRISVLDLTYARVPVTFYGSFKDLRRVRSMAMPWGGVDLARDQFAFPPELEELTLYNSRLNGFFTDNHSHLSKLKTLTMSGCWIDADFSFVPFAAPEGFDSSNTFLPFSKISRQLEKIEFLNCDNRSVASLLFLRWDRLKTITIMRNFHYPRQDGIEIENYLVQSLINTYIDNFPNLTKIVIGYHDMDSMVPAWPRVATDDSFEKNRRWVEIKKDLERQMPDTPFQIDIVGPDGTP